MGKAAGGEGLFGGDLPLAETAAEHATAPPGYLGHRARLRRRLMAGGPNALLDHELLEVVLFLALPRRDTNPMAQALMRRFGGFAEAVAAPPCELDAVPGLGEAGTAALKAVEAAALRLSRVAALERPALDSWERLVGYLAILPARDEAARFRVLFLDRRDRLLADEAQGDGVANHPHLQPLEVVRRALEVGAAALVLIRNQPSGDPSPSRADVETTAGVRTAAAVFGIAVRDHLIACQGRHTSLRREGLL